MKKTLLVLLIAGAAIFALSLKDKAEAWFGVDIAVPGIRVHAPLPPAIVVAPPVAIHGPGYFPRHHRRHHRIWVPGYYSYGYYGSCWVPGYWR